MNFEILLYRRDFKFQISKVSPKGRMSTIILTLSNYLKSGSSVSPVYTELSATPRVLCIPEKLRTLIFDSPSGCVFIVCGHIRDILAKIFRNGRYMEKKTEKYAVLLKSWENFYTRRLYHRIQDCFNRPIATNAGVSIGVIERVSKDGNKTMQVCVILKGMLLWRIALRGHTRIWGVIII